MLPGLQILQSQPAIFRHACAFGRQIQHTRVFTKFSKRARNQNRNTVSSIGRPRCTSYVSKPAIASLVCLSRCLMFSLTGCEECIRALESQ